MRHTSELSQSTSSYILSLQSTHDVFSRLESSAEYSIDILHSDAMIFYYLRYINYSRYCLCKRGRRITRLAIKYIHIKDNV